MNLFGSISRAKGLLKTLVVLVFGLLSVVFYLRKEAERLPKPGSAAMMTMTPIVPALPPKAAAPPPLVVRQVPIERNETFSELMQQQGLDTATIQQIFDSAKNVYNLGRINAGKSMVLTLTPQMTFSALEYSIDPLQKLVIHKSGDTINAELQKFTPEVAVHDLGGTIQGSLYGSINKLGEGDDLVMRFAEIFEWDVDFFKDLQPGDTFRILYEKQTVNGAPLGYGKILAAELVNKGHAYTAIGYQRGSNWEFFSPDGKAMRKMFLAAPLKFTRISSGFTSSRYHPILHTYRAHFGIDYAAPYGTPVRSIGRGRVISAGWAGGAGKMIKIQHDREISTAYCHLSRFAPGIARGASVSQGQVIGYVGATGLATGPHLDFRFMKNGQYVNFLRIPKPQAEPLSLAEATRFMKDTALVATQLQTVKILQPPAALAYASPKSFQLSQ